MSQTHKKCPICKTVKILDDFDKYFSKERNKLRPQNYCRECSPKEKKRRSAEYFLKHKKERLQYAKDYRRNPENSEKLKASSQRFKKQYRENLQPCYVRDQLKQKKGFETKDLRENPEIVEAYTLQIKIKRTLKSIKNGKK